MLDSNDIFTNPVYAKGYDKRSASQSQNYSLQVNYNQQYLVSVKTIYLDNIYIIFYTCRVYKLNAAYR